jgi:hypothetical protein
MFREKSFFSELYTPDLQTSSTPQLKAQNSQILTAVGAALKF